MTSSRPNILLLHSDQHRYDCLGVNGHRLVQTPNLDRLAREGVNFTHAFTPTPICSPARASLLTGAWPTQHGCINIPNSESFRPAREGLPLATELLHDAGYRVAHIGKFHQEVTGSPTEHGVDDFVSAWDYWKWRQQQGLPAEPKTQGWFGETDAHIRPDQSRMAWLADHALRLMQTYAKEGRPFFIRWDPPEPHLPNRPPEPYASMYPPERIAPWPSFPDQLTNKPYAQRRQRLIWGVEDWTWRDWAPIVSRYLADISLLDAQVGRLLAGLDALGLAGNTLVIYTTDHGDMTGAHGMMDKHFSMYDDILRVPLIARFPGQLPAGVTNDAFVSNELDIAAALCETAGLIAPATFAGHSLLATARDGGNARPDIFAMYQGTETGLASQRVVRDHEWKYVWNVTVEDELYHLATDPGELRNLIGDPAAQSELNRLRGRLIAWMEAIKDPLWNIWTKRLFGAAAGTVFKGGVDRVAARG